MPRPRKPARLVYLEDEWQIRDGSVKVRTGLGQGDRSAAESRLVAFIAGRATLEKPIKGRRASDVSAAEVLTRYMSKSDVARPEALAGRVERLLDVWGDKMLSDVDEDTCAAYVESQASPAAARRSLEDFRAAVRAYRKAGFLGEEVILSLPDRAKSREDWLTYEEAVVLVRTAWSHRLVQRGHDTARWHRRHVAKFIVVAIATCSRASRIFEAGYVAQPGQPWLDLDHGLFYRAAPGARTYKNKRSPTVPLTSRLLATLRRWHARGDDYVVTYAGRPADPKRGFASNLALARERYPTLFLRPDGTPKHIVRHSLRHTGVTWLALAGVDPYEICKFSGISMAVFESTYSHHHPSFMAGIEKAQGKKAPVTRLPKPPRPLMLPPPEAYDDEVLDAAE
jgi:integrase